MLQRRTAHLSGNSIEVDGVAQVTAVPKWIQATFILLCLIGMLFSIKLTQIHVLVHTDPSYHSVCAVSEGVNCETVAASPYSVFWGIPVSVWGIAGYLSMLLFGLWSIGRLRLHSAWPWAVIQFLTSIATAASLALAYISATKIDSICLFCMATYFINAVLLVLSTMSIKRLGVGFISLSIRDLNALRTRPVLSVTMLLAAASVLVMGQKFFPTYWKTPGWDDLPQLMSGTDEHRHHWIGADNPKLTIVEFSDYECPHCRAAHKGMRLLASRYPDDIRLLHRHFPLDMDCNEKLTKPFHHRACFFARAAECAGQQGKFWEMNDALFSLQDTIKTKDVDPYLIAVQLGINRSDFKECIAQNIGSKKIKEDIDDALNYKISGTPTFIMDGKRFVGRVPETEIYRRLGVKE